MSIEIRPGLRSDLDGILEVYNHYVLHSPATFDITPLRRVDRLPWLLEHAEGGRHRMFVAVDERGQVAGWATTSRFRERPAYATTVESSVYLRPESTGAGLGSRLYQALFDSIRSEDIERIVAGITQPSPASLALHRRFGFRPIGTFSRVGRKFGEYWDVAWYERPLSLPPGRTGSTR